MSVSHDYSLLNYISLDAGSWADWFSGTMSALAVTIALLAYPITNFQRKSNERQRDRELNLAIGWKLLKVLNHTGDIDRHFKTSLARINPPHQPSLKFPLVQPMGVPQRLIQGLNQNEIDFLLKAQAANLLAEIDMCISRYSSIEYAMSEYKSRHEALFELMPPPVAREGMKFTHQLTKAENDKVKPYAEMLESLLNSIMALVDENMNRTKETIVMYDNETKRYFGKSLMTIELVG